MEEPIVEYKKKPFFKQMVCLYDIEQTTASSSTRQQLLSSPWKFDIFSSILPFLLIQILVRDPVTECIVFFVVVLLFGESHV